MLNEDEKYRDYDESERDTGFWFEATLTIIGAIILSVCIAICCTGCKTVKEVYVPQETVKIEYRDREIERLVADTVRDTRVVFIKGDTVVDYRDRNTIKRIEIHDTVRTETHDTIRELYPVERPLSRWEKAKMDMGGVAIGACAVLALLLILKFKRR